MTDDVYFRLRTFLDNLPGGYPTTESGVEIKILKKLFTPEDAEIVMKLKSKPEPVEKISERLNMRPEEASEKLEKLAKDGSIYRVRNGDIPYYMPIQFVVGIYEFHLNTIDRELSELMEEYLPYLGKVWEKTKTLQLRVVPVGSAVDAAPQIASYNHIFELVKDKKTIVVAPCICRKEQDLLDNTCEKPLETCIVFDNPAEYFIENKMGRKINQKELKKILKTAEDAGLVLSPSGYKDISNICCCCDCCCAVLRNLKNFDRPADYAQSQFQARIDPELCITCGTCSDRCQVEAIVENKDVMTVDTGRCIGCALCVPTCSEEAISLVAKPITTELPKNAFEMGMRILKERGVM
jgi:electron transport complex protein RnfB